MILNGNEVYHTDVSYHLNKHPKSLEAYHTVDEKETGKRFERVWYDNGQLWSRDDRENDQRDGVYQAWYENGQPIYRRSYKNDRPDGLWEEWYKNGQPRVRDHYKDGQLDGPCEGWDIDGKLLYIAVYKMGEHISEENF